MEILKNYGFYIALGAAIFAFLVFVWNIFLQISLSRLKKRNNELFKGNNIKNLEDVILRQGESIKTLDKDIQELYAISNQINSLSFRGLHKVGLIRFNPFKDIGGDQSFSIALVNGKNNGLVISSLYTREGTRVYAKTVVGGKAEKHQFTEEEERALKNAMAQETKKIN